MTVLAGKDSDKLTTYSNKSAEIKTVQTSKNSALHKPSNTHPKDSYNNNH